MKLFAMSWPISKAKPRTSGDCMEYDLPVSVVVSTPVAATMEGLVGGAFRSVELRVGNNSVICESIEAKKFAVLSEEIVVRTLSPITCYAQTQRPDGRKYTVYFDPNSPDFVESVNNNLLRKCRALYPGREAPGGYVEIKPLGKMCERVAQFTSGNSFPIKGWSGTFSLKGPRELLQVGLDCGLGAKNSGGWGCVSLL
jgi:CRISPR-associated endoribonuclease Cas6